METGDIFVRLFSIAAAVNVAANLKTAFSGESAGGWTTATRVTKPLLMPLLIAFHMASAPGPDWTLVVALAFGFLGDVALMVPGENRGWFMAGLGAFAVNLGLYAAIFAAGIDDFGEVPGRWWAIPAAVAYLAYGLVFFRLLAPGLGGLKGPVVFYMAVILAMGMTALARAPSHGGAGWAVWAGSVLFMASDSFLAWDRFRTRFRAARAVTMATYCAAQLLIVAGLQGG